MGPLPLTRIFHEEHNDTLVTFLAPSFWMDLPSSIIHKPKTGLS